MLIDTGKPLEYKAIEKLVKFEEIYDIPSSIVIPPVDLDYFDNLLECEVTI